jgi:hypothetical protein
MTLLESCKRGIPIVSEYRFFIVGRWVHPYRNNENERIKVAIKQ